MHTRLRTGLRDRIGVLFRQNPLIAALELLVVPLLLGLHAINVFPKPKLPLLGFAHHGQGITGILDNVIAGALFVTLYFAARRNLWLPILVHGMIDTTSVVLLYFGFHL